MKLVNWRYVSNSINDGDSFMDKNRGTTYVFRLYWVDTPEARENYPARVREQAEYFGISTEEVMQIGREAKLFTRELLKGQSLTSTKFNDFRLLNKERVQNLNILKWPNL